MQPRHLARLSITPRRRLPANQALLASAVFTALAISAPAQSQFEALPRQGLPGDNDYTYSTVLVDVDGDGDLDLICGNSGQNRLYINDGSGVFEDVTATQMPVLSDATNSLAVGDVDGDGDLDIVTGNSYQWYSGGQTRLLLNDGSGTFTDATAAQMPVDNVQTQSVALGDVDGDGDLDLVCGNFQSGYYGSSGQNQLYLNDGSGTFTDATATQMPALVDATNEVVLGDVDGDGDLDLAVGNGFFYQGYWYSPPTWGEQNRLLINDGLGNFTDVTASNMPVDNQWTRAMAMVDVDFDGDLDLVCGNMDSVIQSAQNRLYLNDGAGVFTDATGTKMPVASDRTTSIAVADVDEDGDPDLITGSEFWGGMQNRVFLNNGLGTFTDETLARLTWGDSTTMSVSVGDVDGDGDQDLVCGNIGSLFSGPQNSLLVNLSRQLEAPLPYLIGQTYTLNAYRRFGPTSQFEFALPYLSLATASIPLPPFGTVGIDPLQAVAMPLITIPPATGVGSTSMPIPVVLGLIGTPIYSQALMLSVPIEGRLSNVLTDEYAPLSPPTITSIMPPSAAPGGSVTVDGTNFLNGLTLVVDNIPTPIASYTATSLTFQMPVGSGCDALVEVFNLGGSTANQMMNVSPTVSSASASIGPAVGGALFTVNGQDLQGTTVTFNGVPMTNITTQTQTVITGTTPPGTPGPAVVAISNAMGCQATVNYTYDATPTLMSVNPPSALAGTPVTVNGNNFLSGVSLTVGGNATPITSFTDTTVTFQMPAGAGCDTTVEVTNVGSTSVPILMNGTPTISYFPFTAGPMAGGATFVVTGQNLSGTTVTFNGVPATSITSQSNSVIVGQTPPGSFGLAPVVIFNVVGCTATTSYTYQ